MELAADKGESVGGCLWIRNINFGVRFAVEAVVFDAAANPDDRHPVTPVSNPFADWAFVRPMPSRERFVDDGDAGRGLVVVFGEIAALFKRNLHGREIAGADRPHLRGQLYARGLRLTFDAVTITPGVAAERQMGDGAD